MKSKHKTKNRISLFVIKFCSSIADETPLLVPLRPLDDRPINECFNIVPEHIQNNGGEQVVGWCIHVWKKVLIEAEFHCVWKTPNNELVDITPKIFEQEFIIFLPDSKMHYNGRQVDNIRKSISSDKHVAEYIELSKEYFCYINKGDLADYHGVVEIKEDFRGQLESLRELETGLIRKYGNHRGVSINNKFMRYKLLPHRQSMWKN